MSSDPRLEATLTILMDAGHQIDDAYIPPLHDGEEMMRIWIDGVPCTLKSVFRVAEEEIEAEDEEKPESPS